jgi:hypothetical protein
VYGTVDKRATYICEMHKARSLAIVYFHNSYHKKYNDGQVKDLWIPRQWAIPIVGEEEYNNLVKLTKELGGYVNEDATMVKIDALLNNIPNKDISNIEILQR